MDRKNPLLRTYGPLRADYDTLIAQARGSDSSHDQIARIEATRDSIETMRLALLPDYLESINAPNASTRILDLFVRNFPEHPLAGRMRLRLAHAYRLSGRTDLAAEKLGEMVSGLPPSAPAVDSTDTDRARAELRRTIPMIGDPDVCQRIFRRVDDPSLRDAAAAQIREVAAQAGGMPEPHVDRVSLFLVDQSLAGKLLDCGIEAEADLRQVRPVGVAAALGKPVEFLQLAGAERGLYIRKPVIKAQRLHLVIPGPGIFPKDPFFFCNPVRTQQLQPPAQLLIVCRNSAAFSGRDVF
mgnify:CR=1 FL=1